MAIKIVYKNSDIRRYGATCSIVRKNGGFADYDLYSYSYLKLSCFVCQCVNAMLSPVFNKFQHHSGEFLPHSSLVNTKIFFLWVRTNKTMQLILVF